LSLNLFFRLWSPAFRSGGGWGHCLLGGAGRRTGFGLLPHRLGDPFVLEFEARSGRIASKQSVTHRRRARRSSLITVHLDGTAADRLVISTQAGIENLDKLLLDARFRGNPADGAVGSL
jgi:hypothetical protein